MKVKATIEFEIDTEYDSDRDALAKWEVLLVDLFDVRKTNVNEITVEQTYDEG